MLYFDYPKRKEVYDMKYNIKGLNVSVYDSMKDRIEKKLGKLAKFFPEDTVAEVTLSSQKDDRIIEITIPVKGSLLRVEEKSDDFTYTLDQAISVLERQLRRHRTKLIDRVQNKESFSALFEAPEEILEEEGTIKIEKVKKFDFKPMDPVEACLQMDLLGHDFFVFKDSQTDETCVVYKRRNGTYGLIEPES